MEIKIKYLSDIPEIGKIKKGDWIDLRAAEDIVMGLFEYKEIPLGIAMELPDGYEAIMAPRSSTFKKYGIIMTNSIGVIDETYCGDDDQWHFPALCVKPKIASFLWWRAPVTKIPKGERICQFRIIEHQPEIELNKVDTLGNANRGGIGSTGRK